MLALSPRILQRRLAVRIAAFVHLLEQLELKHQPGSSEKAKADIYFKNVIMLTFQRAMSADEVDMRRVIRNSSVCISQGPVT